MKIITKEDIEDAIKITNTMSEACVKLGIQFGTFKRKAIKFGLYVPNQGGKGSKKPWMSSRKISIDEILEGKHPQFQAFKLKQKLFKTGKKKNECEVCGLNEWNGKTIECELHHLNGNHNDHRFDNLQIICPNCHSQTETFRSKKR